MRSLLFCALATALALSACSTAPQSKQEFAAPTAQWDHPSSGDWPAPDWWRGFNLDSLNVLIERAVAANLDLQIALAHVREADAQVRIAGATQWPSLSLQGDQSRARNGPTAPTTPQSYASNSMALGLTASYQVDFWGSNANTARAAKDLALASRFDRQTVALTIESQVASSYFSILAMGERLELARSNLGNAEHTLQAIRARAAAGIASELDIAQEEGLVDAQRAQIPPLELALDQEQTALAILLGLAPQGFKPPHAHLADVRLPAIGAGVPSALLRRRPDIQSAEAQLAAVNASLQAAEAARFPSLTLSADVGRSASLWTALSAPATVFYAVGATLSQALLSGGSIAGNIDLQQARLQDYDLQYRQHMISAFKEVEDALVAVTQSARQVQAQRDAVKTNQRAYDIAQARLYTGTIDILTVLNTQTTLFATEDLLLQNELAQIQANVQLFLALGGGWTCEPSDASPTPH